MNRSQKKHLKRDLSTLFKAWAWMTLGAFVLIVIAVLALVFTGLASST